MDLGQSTAVKEIVIYNMNNCLFPTICRMQLSNSIVTLRDASDNIVASYNIGDASQLNQIVVSAVVNKNFYLENPSSGKVLGVRGNDCTSGFIHVQDQSDSGSSYQQWSLTDEGYLKNNGCSNKFLSNRHDSCTSGNELALSSSGEKWSFHKDGRIVHVKCKSHICKARKC